MANVRKKGGLRLYNCSIDQPLEVCFIPSSDGTIVGRGDAVKTAGSAGSSGVNGPTVKTVARAAATNPVYGVVEGFLEHWVPGTGMSLDRTHRPASTDMYVLVRPANHQDVYAITDDSVGGALAAADIGLNADIVVTSDADTLSGLSNMELDTSTKNTTATLQLKIIGVVPKADNTLGQDNADILVRLNNIEISGGTGTAGV